jgi:tryptophan 7-halogenase
MEDCDHRGYVFASAFAGVEQAAAEMRAKNPGMGDFWTVKFRSGRHEEFWRGNCVAIGNSFAFVEPLQSTAIHMIIIEIKKLIAAFPREPMLHAFQPLVNREIIEVWDTLRWFLGAHYRFNRKLETPFWQECLRAADVTGIQEVIDVYRERAPIGATAHRFKELDLSTFGAYRHDLLFMGMGIPTKYATPLDDEASWRRASAATARVAARALPHLEALQVLRQDPDLLRRHGAELAGI